MNSRRKFISHSAAAVASLPFLSTDVYNRKYDLSLLKLSDSDSEEYWQQVRLQFPLKEGQTYFNNGTMGPTSGYALNKMMEHMRYYSVHAAEVDYKNGSGPELLSGYFRYEDIRKKIGVIINADFKNIALTQNATFGMNFVANGLELKKGDEIINTDQEHGGGFAAWRQLAKRYGCVYKMAKMPVPANDPQEIIDSIFSQVTKKTKVIAVPHIISTFGVVLPVREICQKAREMGIFTVLDGAQTVGQIKVDVKDIGCDAYYSSLHKWLLAPAGNGILYINPEKINDIWSTIASYNWDNKDDNGFRFTQTGTGNPGLLVGLEASIDFYNTIGEDRWITRIKELGDYLRSGLKEISHVKISSSTHPDMCAGITTYGVKGINGPNLQKLLWEKERLQPRSIGSELLRHSVHIYNNKEEIDRALKVIKEYI